MARVAVVGASSWGTTLGVLLARGGAEVTLFCRSAAEAEAISAARENQRHRPGLALPDGVTASVAPGRLAEAETVVVAVPSASLDANLRTISPHLNDAATLVSATKGIEPATGRRMSEIIAASGIDAARVLALSGPNFADEIARGLPASTVVAGPDPERAATVQQLLNGPAFRVYTSADIVGVELGGALKNVVAIACGISDGLGYGANARAGLITRSLAEITRLGVAAGATALTFQGLAGLGDLVLSCSSDLSRNRRLGLTLGRGLTLDAAQQEVGGLVEGAETARAIPALVRRYGVEMPICSALYHVLYESTSPAAAVQALMARAARAEIDDSLTV